MTRILCDKLRHFHKVWAHSIARSSASIVQTQLTDGAFAKYEVPTPQCVPSSKTLCAPRRWTNQ